MALFIQYVTNTLVISFMIPFITVAVGGSVSRGSVFADLSVEEMNQINDYLYKQKDLNLKDPLTATLRDAVIFLVEAIRPPKAAALVYLDDAGPAPERAARVVIHR